MHINAKSHAWILVLAAGCRHEAVELAREAADRQAAQNVMMGRLQGDVTRGTELLVAADAASRNEALATYRHLQEERGLLAVQFDRLELERRQLDDTRRSAGTVGTAVRGTGVLLVSALTLLVIYRQLASASVDPVTAELAVDLWAHAYETEASQSVLTANQGEPRPSLTSEEPR